MVRSMTGFGRAKVRTKDAEIEVEIRSVNHRYLQIRQKLPETLSGNESVLEERIKKTIQRGSISLYVSLTHTQQGKDFQIREDLARFYHRQLQKIQKGLKIKSEITLRDITALPGVIEAKDSATARTKDLQLALQVLDKATKAMDQSRLREGKKLGSDLSQRRKRFRKFVNAL